MKRISGLTVIFLLAFLVAGHAEEENSLLLARAEISEVDSFSTQSPTVGVKSRLDFALGGFEAEEPALTLTDEDLGQIRGGTVEGMIPQAPQPFLADIILWDEVENNFGDRVSNDANKNINVVSW